MSRRLRFTALDQSEVESLGTALGQALAPGLVVYLSGELGAGKTTLARAMLRARAPQLRVKSPTYSLLERYALGALVVAHLDLYRIADADEVAVLGLRDLIAEGAVLLIEWPERGAGVLPAPDWRICLTHADSRRELSIEASSPRGEMRLPALGKT